MKILFRPDNPSKRYPFKVVRSQATVDLAILSADIPAGEFEPLQVATGSSPQYRDLIQVVGWPEFSPGDGITIMDSPHHGI